MFRTDHAGGSTAVAEPARGSRSHSMRRRNFASCAAAVLALLLWATGAAADFSAVGEPREFKSAAGVREWRFESSAGISSFDKIGLHRIATAATVQKPNVVMLYLPGTNMNGEVALDDPAHEFRLFLAEH